ncbi:hypothetical protein [Legionella shakespearei]|uniref:Ankyrin repeats (3 copies) n=1 Tax=Legionella shakespearei DSM 23087 TaxID=1122169 RepID=A0A0W0Z0D1_9GAMM|nr:hypothetical protein [Legionella shakespearei]KTD62366.1 hypothetical protein Lsha_1066 [Legionella shakespearei DSM 23087]
MITNGSFFSADQDLEYYQEQPTQPKTLDDLRHLTSSSLSSIHTRLFIERIGWGSDLLNSVINDDVVLFAKESNKCSPDDLKELQLIAAFFSAKNVLSELHDNRGRILNIETLNIALLSGSYIGDALNQFVNDQVRPTYNSIRYAIRSGQVDVLRDVLDRYNLKPGNEHLIGAALIGNNAMLLELINRGAVPEHDFLYVVASRPGNEKIMDTLQHHFGDADSQSLESNNTNGDRLD